MTNAFNLALAQLNPIVGDLAGNAQKMLQFAAQAADLGADLVLYPEMCLTGYPPEDLVLIPAFRAAAMHTAQKLAQDAKDLPCDLIFGNLWHDGEHTYNASLLASKGQLTLLRAKHDLPNYGVFDEKRVFHAGPEPKVFEWRGIKLGLLICEEVWDVAQAELLGRQGAEILLVQNASPYHIGKDRQRRAVVEAAAAATKSPVVYLNLVGGQDELVFDGRSYAVSPDGKDIARMSGFQEELGLLTFKHQGAWKITAAPMADIAADEETIYHALVLGLRDYVAKNKFPSVVLGLSGGIDSGVTAAIAADALGPEKVHTIRLPSPYTSVDSIEDAQQLAEILHLKLDTIPITPLMDAARQTLAPLFSGRHADVTEENIQARLRGLLLMAVSNKFGAMVLTTGNKSEMSVGYATLYGDMCGGFSVLKDVYKTTVVKLANWRNEQRAESLARLGFLGAATEGATAPVIPHRMITKPPTAELRPNQRDEDSLPPYDLLDTILRGLVERQLSIAELVAEGLEEHTVARVARLLVGAEYKRRQSAPGVKITPMAFGRDRRWPITNRWKLA